MSTEQDTLTSEASKDVSSSDLLSQPWDKLLGDSPAGNCIPKIIRTRPSFEVPRNDHAINMSNDPNSLSPNVPPPPGVGRLTRTQSLGARRVSNGLLGNFHKQLRFSLRGDRSSGKDGNGPLFRYRQARYASRRVRKRVVFKHGDCNVVQGNVSKRRKRYLQDLFTTLVDAQWRWTLLVFAMSFLLSWLGFALVWWLIAYAHGDLEHNESLAPCVVNVYSFTTSFLFSVETQHTIGYGGRSTTDECPEAIFIMCLQSIVGVFIQAFMVGIVFAKLSRPKKRTQTLLFSQSAVICQRDGQLVFMFRVGDMRKSHIIEAHVRAQIIMKKVGLIFAKLARAKKRTTTLLFSRNAVVCLRDGEFCLLFRVGDIRKSHILEAHVRAQIIRKKVTKEGELLPFYQQELRVGADGEEDRLMFIWPTTIVHKINENSPLYNLSASDMLRERFEIVVMLEGVIESTGMTTQARSSYLPSEIFWGHRFEPIVAFKKETGEYEVDYTLFNNTYEVDTPLCSAKQLDDLRKAVASPNKLDRLAVSSTIPVELGPSPSNDTLDSCSVDSMSLDEHIEIKIPESRIQENRRLMELQQQQQQQPAVAHHHVHYQNGDVKQNGGIVHKQNGDGDDAQNHDEDTGRSSSEQNGGIFINGHNNKNISSKSSLKSRSVENTHKIHYGSNSHLYNFQYNGNEEFVPHHHGDHVRNGTNGNHIRMYRTASGHLTPRAMTDTPPPIKITIDPTDENVIHNTHNNPVDIV